MVQIGPCSSYSKAEPLCFEARARGASSISSGLYTLLSVEASSRS